MAQKAESNCGLHPLVHTLLEMNLVQDVADRGSRWSETRGTLETYTHCMGHGFVFERGIGPDYPGRGKYVSRFRRPND